MLCSPDYILCNKALKEKKISSAEILKLWEEKYEKKEGGEGRKCQGKNTRIKMEREKERGPSREGEQHGPREKGEEFTELKTISVPGAGENKGRGRRQGSELGWRRTQPALEVMVKDH